MNLTTVRTEITSVSTDISIIPFSEREFPRTANFKYKDSLSITKTKVKKKNTIFIKLLEGKQQKTNTNIC